MPKFCGPACLLLAALLPAPAAYAEDAPGNSKPVAQLVTDEVPTARDIAFPGKMQLDVDATDVTRAIFRVKQTIPVPPAARKAGRMVLLFPEWLQGNHAPRGEIEKLVGLRFSAGGRVVGWRRDSLDVYAFHLAIPADAREISAEFQFVSPTDSDQGRVVIAPRMMNLRWHNVALYPAGYYTRNIPVQASVTWPDGWQAATALRPEAASGSRVTYAPTDFDTLVDSPVFAGAHFRSWPLSDRVTLNVVADAPEFLEASEEQIAHHRRLVKEAEHLFGARHYDHYDFLLSLSEEMGGIGIEHHRSSENGVDTGYFTEWTRGPGRRNLLPHELTHSWIGKYRRPAGIWTPDFRTPTRDDLLWVYEGQNQLWGYVLGARAGLFSKQDTLDALAAIAADQDLRVGRQWRPLADTTHDPIIAARRPKPWTSWQRSEDYYNEGLLVWLEIDGIIRRESGGERSLQDFARSFFGGRDGDWGVQTFELADVIATLQAVQPYGWEDFIDRRVMRISDSAPKDGLALGGYELVYTDQPSAFIRSAEDRANATDLSYSIGIEVKTNGDIRAVIWDSPAFAAGLTNGDRIVAVNGDDFSTATLKQAVIDSPAGKSIQLLVKKGKRYRETAISYEGGLRYPALRKIGEGEGGIDRLLAPQVTASPDQQP
ncbi:MAG: PDZ domain-containing protein [Blastomonas sp.]